MNKVKIFRKMNELGMNQKDLARETGLTESAISRFINETRQPRLYNLIKIADALEMTLDELARED